MISFDLKFRVATSTFVCYICLSYFICMPDVLAHWVIIVLCIFNVKSENVLHWKLYQCTCFIMPVTDTFFVNLSRDVVCTPEKEKDYAS
uniref:Uncharacterized protein n=1 Tax=Arundo donax TaxID=35708 RepID=A0A0A9B3A4_ARUDO